MVRVFLDTNFLLDLALEHRPGGKAAAEILQRAEEGELAGIVSPSSLKDFYYIARKDMPDDLRRGWIAFFMDGFAVADTNRSVCQNALVSDEPDFEDGIVRAIAEDEGCDYILTRDAKGFDGSKAPKIEPEELSVFATEKR